MTTLTHPKSFQELLTYDDGTDNAYELTDGELKPVAPETYLNRQIAKFLAQHLQQFFSLKLIELNGPEIEVAPLPGMPVNRLPDLVVLHPDHPDLLVAANGVSMAMPPPLLIVEVVSPYTHPLDPNFTRDYGDKPQQYAIRGIPEYWIVDPQRALIEVNWDPHQSRRCYLSQANFQGIDPVRSQLPQLGKLQLTAEQILNPDGGQG